MSAGIVIGLNAALGAPIYKTLNGAPTTSAPSYVSWILGMGEGLGAVLCIAGVSLLAIRASPE